MSILDSGVSPIQVRRVRLRGAAGVARARLCLESALADVEPAALGLSPRMLLVVRRVASEVPLRLVPTGGDAFGRAVRAELERSRRGAVRPWVDPGASQAGAVLFRDEAELAACLVRDELRGDLGLRWWARAALDGLSPPEWWRRELLPRGDLLPAVLTLLAGQGQAVPWVARLSEAEAGTATTAIAAAHGLVPCAPQQDAGSFVAGWGNEPRLADREDPTGVYADQARLTAFVPEVQAVGGSAPRARLLALALGLQRAPAWVRGPRFGLALRALGTPPAAADGRPAAPHTIPRGARPVIAGSARVGQPLSHSEPDMVTAPPSSGAGPYPEESADRAVARDPALAPSSSTPVAERHPALLMARIGGADAPPPVAHPQDHPARFQAEVETEHQPGPTPPQGSRKLVRVLRQPETRPGVTPTPHGDRCEGGTGRVAWIGAAQPEGTLAAGSSLMGTTHPTAVPASPPDWAARSTIPDHPERTSRLDATDPNGRDDVLPAPIPNLAPEAIETAYGGLLYLLNLALALGLYGDFTQPRRPGITLSPWDWLALVGRAWLGRRIERDPLWHLLARLAGRPPTQPPGLDFAAPTNWSVPPDWPLPWGATGPVGVQGRGDRLRLWHPAGFLLADLRRSAGIEVLTQAAEVRERWPVLAAAPLVRVSRPPTPARSDPRRARSARQRMPQQRALARWLARLLPYLEARLALALGEDDPATVPTLVCRHAAQIQVSATALDVHLSLAELPIAIRIAGLDRDPGWIPAADRSVAFHFA